MGSNLASINRRLNVITASKNIVKTAAATLGVYEQNVLCDSTAGAMTMTMPRAEDAAGLTFFIRLTVDGGNVTVAYPAAAGQDPNDTVLTAVDDYVQLTSSGEGWHIDSVDVT